MKMDEAGEKAEKEQIESINNQTTFATRYAIDRNQKYVL